MTRKTGDPKIISISSGKGGVGKTSLTVNLAYVLAQGGTRTLVVDGDLGLANIDVLLGLVVPKTIGDILDRGEDPARALITLEPGLAILPAASGAPALADLGHNDRDMLEGILAELGRDFDLILIDTAAGLGAAVLWFNTFARHNIIVVTPDPTSLTDAYALMKVLCQQHGRKGFHIVVNQGAHEEEARGVFTHLAGVAQRFLELPLRYLGAVPQSPEVAQAVRRQMPFVKSAPQGKAAKAIVHLAQRLSAS